MRRNIDRPQSANGATYGAHLDTASIIIGNLVLQNSARIAGTAEGNIAAMGHLIIADTAEVTGWIEATSVEVSGKIAGDIKATERLEIRASARIIGNLTSPILVVEPGAVLDGRCFMSETSSKEQESRVKAEAIVLKDPVGQSEEAPLQPGVSFFITQRQRADLRARGYDDAAIDKMTPADAHQVVGLNSGSLVLVDHFQASSTLRQISAKRRRRR